ncbi:MULTISPECIES: component of SufBCD complex [unclassified Ruegeria]|uniref:component of SufBCD complex n=1 Tax=unclassified Ruegeria TaxID=2625375 RepID=UPI001ADB19A8|nr:component of SufBCD complex [Ruegeria sp. R8_1]MBO9414203.1 component of SufBCD complex [Ruegeria sp. R8_2]
MNLYSSIFEVIDMRSFSNLWYWIVLAVLWSSASHWAMGVPFDLVSRARRNGGQAEQDLLDIVRINVNRLIYIVEVSGLVILAFGCFFFTGLATLGFYYGIELAQAVFLLLFPVGLVMLINISAARKLQRTEVGLEPVAKILTRCRIYTQIVGMISILITSLWGMYQNFSIGVLG